MRLLLAILAGIGLLPLSGFSAEAPSFVKNQTEFKTGQVIAISEMSFDPTTLFFEAGTGSRFGHIGIVVVEGGKTYVYESNPPAVQRTSLAAFLKRSLVLKRHMATVLEPVVPLTLAEQTALTNSVRASVAAGIPYNFSMVLNEGAVNCSEFVYKTFLGIGRDGFGQVETMAEMNLNSMSGYLLQLWSMSGEPPDAEDKVLTPVSIVNSKKLTVIASNLPVNQLISDQEILRAWIDGGGIANLGALLDVDGFERTCEVLLGSVSTKPYRAYPKSWRK